MQLDAQDLTAADDAQKVAILEALLLAIHADGVVSPAEINRFDRIVGSLPWGVDRPVLIAMIQGAQQRLARVKGPQGVMDFVAGIASRVTAPELREKVLYSMGVVAGADGTFHQFEKNLLGLVAVSFNISSERLGAIKAAVQQTLPAPAAKGQAEGGPEPGEK